MDRALALAHTYTRVRRTDGEFDAAYAVSLTPRAGAAVVRLHHHDFAYVEGKLIGGGMSDQAEGTRPIEIWGSANAGCPALEADGPVHLRAVVGILAEIREADATHTEEIWLATEASPGKGETDHAAELVEIPKPPDLSISFED